MAEQHGWTRFISMQNHYNLIYREEEREMIPLCVEMGIGVIPWSPLARGFLAGNRREADWGETVRTKSDPFAHSLYYADADFQVVERVRRGGGAAGCHAGAGGAGMAAAPTRGQAPIIGATKMQHLEDAVGAVDVKLSAEDVALLEAPYVPHPVLGHS